MPGIVIKQSLSDYAKWAGKLGAGFMGAIQRGTVSGAARCITVVQRATREAKPANPRGVGVGGAVNTGGYLAGWRSTALAPIGAAVFNGKLHAAIIEEGRRPGGFFPPRDVIMRWAQRRLGLSEVDAKRAAWPIARAIQRRGLLPRKVMEGAVPEMVDVVQEEQVRELDAAMQSRSG